MSDAKATFFGETDLGRVRTNNEDTYICQTIWDDRHILCAAIDGMGGYEGGEVAADIARTTILKHLEDFASDKYGRLLKDALIEANNEIVRQHDVRPKVSQMGCVASVGLIDLDHKILYTAHVGDSRIYGFTDGKLKKLTHDHSLVGYREEIGEMTEEDAMRHPKRNVIDRFLGEKHLSADSESYVEVAVFPITGHTQYLFCSDGLTDLVTSARLSAVLSSNKSVEKKVNTLIRDANEAGGKDNVTVVIAEVEIDARPGVAPATNGAEPLLARRDAPGEEAPAENTGAPAHGRRKRGGWKLAAGVLLGLATGIAIACCFFTYQANTYKTTITELKKKNSTLQTKIVQQADSILRLQQPEKEAVPPTDQEQ